MQSADKLFGNFTFGNLPPTTVNFSVTNPSSSEEDHNLSFTASFQQGVTYTSLGFEVEINPPTAGTVITTLKGDFTQTSSTTSTLTKNSTPTGTPAGGINETKVGSTPSGTLSITYSPGVQDIIVSESLVDNGTIQNILDTVIESGSFTTSTPEPGSLMLLGSALAGMGLLGRRRRKAL